MTAKTNSKTVEAFALRNGTRRETLVTFLLANFGKPVAMPTVIAKVYGSRASEAKFTNALKMSLRGMKATIEENKIPVALKVDHENNTIGLFRKR